MVGSKKQLAVFLSKLEVFTAPNVRLEQYPTDSEVAAAVLWDAYLLGDIEEKHIVDLGAGTGILGIGALALGAAKVTFVEIDRTLLPVLQRNLALVSGDAEIVLQDIAHVAFRADVVIQNPPFGTRGVHADRIFLGKALQIAPVVYSFHKTSTLDYIGEWAPKQGFPLTHRWNFQFPLKQTLRQHTKKILRIEVSCLRFASAK